MRLRRGYFVRACLRFLSSVQKRLTLQSRLWAALVNQENLLRWCFFWRRRGRAILRGRWWRLMGGGQLSRHLLIDILLYMRAYDRTMIVFVLATIFMATLPIDHLEAPVATGTTLQ